MTPVPLTDLDILALSPCVEHVISGGADFQDLPSAIVSNRADCPVVTRWALTEEERAYFAAGGDLYLSILTFGEASFQPILPTAGVPIYDGSQSQPVA